MTTPAEIVAAVEGAYQKVQTYQAEMEVREYRKGELHETRKFRYSFKKPDHLRVEMETPHRGTVLTYPDSERKVLVRPGGVAGFMRLRLPPESGILQSDSGQRIDQTDLGQLIAHIARCVSAAKKGGASVSQEEGRLIVEALADDPFKPRTLVHYRFAIDRTLLLPVDITESSAEGVLLRRVSLRNLRTGVTFPEDFFDTE